jgi:uncharacterized phage-associated protein/DNA-binding transcriptional regulator YiaG
MRDTADSHPALGPRSETQSEPHLLTLTIRGEPITVLVGSSDSDKDLEEQGRQLALYRYREKHAILDPHQIRVLRGRYSLGQKAFGRLLGMGEATVARYEAGALPTTAHNDLLVALTDPATMRRFISRHYQRLAPTEWKRVQQALDEAKYDVKAAELRAATGDLLASRSDIERGHRPFDFERFAQMTVFFALLEAVTLTKLLKLLWWADFLAFKRAGSSLSGTPYVRYKFGPVPELYQLLLNEVEREGLISTETIIYDTVDGPQPGTKYSAIERFDTYMFTADERAILERVCNTFGSMSAKQLANLSHKETPWLETEDREVIPYTLARHLSID